MMMNTGWALVMIVAELRSMSMAIQAAFSATMSSVILAFRAERP